MGIKYEERTPKFIIVTTMLVIIAMAFMAYELFSIRGWEVLPLILFALLIILLAGIAVYNQLIRCFAITDTTIFLKTLSKEKTIPFKEIETVEEAKCAMAISPNFKTKQGLVKPDLIFSSPKFEQYFVEAPRPWNFGLMIYTKSGEKIFVETATDPNKLLKLIKQS